MKLEKYLFGEILQSFREYKSLSLEELAGGICTVEELVSFEKERAYPTLDVLYKFAKKLDMELTYFFDIASKTTIHYPNAVIQLIEKYKRERDYVAINNIIQSEKYSPLFNQKSLKQYLMWHQGICYHHLDGDSDRAFDTLSKAIALTNPKRVSLTEREIEILTSIGLIFYDTKNYRSAVTIFLEALSSIENLPHVLNMKGQLRILFGLSQAYTKLDMYEESLSYCYKGLNLCINEELLYLLNEFYYQIGHNYVKIGEVDKGKYYLEECLHLLRLEKKTRLLKIMEIEIDNLLNS
ncbi:helix-turn-helix transcriptional regulator [Bacillus sp. S/N-304-OC-R1]|uniref:helix-turn-helix domain-containing protein n=1 Tax=Bacillus sp. S/N-304-OC-R1 TaxID=2758034 RepID=UPI001C8F02A9|nr:helix-turn-helix transcriptional regulator [Bacillus sp. S/N-304-OC-R1]MBY0122289.1 helix-turn-helix transcriptional regulator [Bacillus sp. S/N-304-OC-R1]